MSGVLFSLKGGVLLVRHKAHTNHSVDKMGKP
jgi:hypothetical protein